MRWDGTDRAVQLGLRAAMKPTDTPASGERRLDRQLTEGNRGRERDSQNARLGARQGDRDRYREGRFE